MFRTTAYIGLLSLIFLALTSCEKETISPNTEFTLKLNETKVIKDGLNNVSLTYTEVIEDSRCPDSSTCVWAGRAIVELTDNHKNTYQIGMGDLEANENKVKNEITINGFLFKLLDVYNNEILLEVTK